MIDLTTCDKWEDVPEDQKLAVMSYFKTTFPDEAIVYVVLDAEINLPLAICTTRERAIAVAEGIIKNKFNGIRYIIGEEEESRIRVHTAPQNCEIDETLFDFDVGCWKS